MPVTAGGGGRPPPPRGAGAGSPPPPPALIPGRWKEGGGPPRETLGGGPRRRVWLKDTDPQEGREIVAPRPGGRGNPAPIPPAAFPGPGRDPGDRAGPPAEAAG